MKILRISEGFVNIDGFPNYTINRDGIIMSKTSNRIIKTQIQTSGYEIVHLRRDGSRKAFTVHRLVAKIFVPNSNPRNKVQVNHKNGNKTDNRADNLEWVSRKENMRHAFEIGLMDNAIKKARQRMEVIGAKYAKQNGDFLRELSKKTSKPVVQLDMGGSFINEYSSIKEAIRKFGNSNIRKAVSGEYKQASGYKWVLKSIYLSL